PARAAPPRSSASTPVPSGAGSRSSAFRDPLANSGGRSRNVARPVVRRLGTTPHPSSAATADVPSTTDKAYARHRSPARGSLFRGAALRGGGRRAQDHPAFPEGGADDQARR